MKLSAALVEEACELFWSCLGLKKMTRACVLGPGGDWKRVRFAGCTLGTLWPPALASLAMLLRRDPRSCAPACCRSVTSLLVCLTLPPVCCSSLWA
jgi:ABC-type cobalamin transport system ATPase subunit